MGGPRSLARCSLTHLASIKPPARLAPFLAKDQLNPPEPARLLHGRHRTQKRIDFAIDHALRRGVAHRGQRHVEHVERHGRYDAEETVEQDRMEERPERFARGLTIDGLEMGVLVKYIFVYINTYFFYVRYQTILLEAYHPFSEHATKGEQAAGK